MKSSMLKCFAIQRLVSLPDYTWRNCYWFQQSPPRKSCTCKARLGNASEITQSRKFRLEISTLEPLYQRMWHQRGRQVLSPERQGNTDDTSLRGTLGMHTLEVGHWAWSNCFKGIFPSQVSDNAMFGLSYSVKATVFQLNASLLKVITAEGHTHHTYGIRQGKQKPCRRLNSSQVFKNYMQFLQLGKAITLKLLLLLGNTPFTSCTFLFKIKDTYLSAKQIHFTTSYRELLQDSQHKENQLSYASALLHPTVIS